MMYKRDAHAALELIQEEKITGLASVPAVIQDLLYQPDFDRFNTDLLIRVSAAGASTRMVFCLSPGASAPRQQFA
jgi:acyl-CoA synthetase (AMP-forming)/AMP-acid ligase II